MKKYKSVVSQLSVDQITLSEQNQQIAELEHEKQVRRLDLEHLPCGILHFVQDL